MNSHIPMALILISISLALILNLDCAHAQNISSTSLNGVWVWSTEMDNVSFSYLKSRDITNIFLFQRAFEDPTLQNSTKEFINKAKNENIRVHAWIMCLRQNDTWIDPVKHPEIKDVLVQKATKYIKEYNVDGIHLDYIRYPGNAPKNGTDIIADIVKYVYESVKKIKPNALVSAAVMPEMWANYIYGQDYTKMSRYLDFIVPMAYKGNYNETTEWIGKVTRYVVEHSLKPVVTGILAYRSDKNPVKLPASELVQDIRAALENGASGFAIFRYSMIDPDFFAPYLYNITIKNLGNSFVKISYYVSIYTDSVKGNKVFYKEYSLVLGPGEEITLNLGKYPNTYAVSTTLIFTNFVRYHKLLNLQLKYCIEGCNPQIVEICKYIAPKSVFKHVTRFTNKDKTVDIW